MDSPGLCDTRKSRDEICTSIVQTIACTHPGPDAILYVVRMGRYTDEDFGVYRRLKALFDENITKYLILLFTWGDELEKHGDQFDKLLTNSPKTLRQTVQECDNRVILFNNMAEVEIKQAQVESLLSKVRKMKTANEGKPYTCPKYAMVSEGLEAEVRRRLEEVDQSIKELELKIKQAAEEAEEEKKRFEEGKKERDAKIAEEEAKYQHQLEHKAKELSAENLESIREEMEGEKMRLINELKEQSELERQEMERKLEDIKKLMEQMTEEKRREEERWEKKHEEQLERLKDAIAKDEEPGFIKRAVGSIASIVAAPFKWAASLFT